MPIKVQGFEDRELGLIKNCIQYAENDPSGLPGHQLMLIVVKLYKELTEPSYEYQKKIILNVIDNFTQEWNGELESLDRIDIREYVYLLERIL